MRPVIYLDHNATTPLRDEAADAMAPLLRLPLNASSVHRMGQQARVAVDDAREQLAEALCCTPSEVVFTSGGTESNNLALRGSLNQGDQLVNSAVEHPAVAATARALEAAGVRVDTIPVGVDGSLDLAAAQRLITPSTRLVSVMFVNNETGAIHPIRELGLICRLQGVSLHVDAVQALGKLPVDLATLPVDLLTVSAHKVGGPQGAGALFVRKGIRLSGQQTGGPQERGRRGGTETVAVVAGFGVAARLAALEQQRQGERWSQLSEHLRRRLSERVPQAVPTLPLGVGVPSTVHFAIPGIEGEALQMALDLRGICVSTGSACSSGSLEPSKVLLAMGLPLERVRGAVRISMGRTTSVDELDALVDALVDIVPTLTRHLRL